MEDSSEVKGSPEELSFEEAYRQIEKIVALLESGRGELEESLEHYEKAVRLVRLCRGKLDAASQRIELLKGLDEDGAPVLEKLDETALRSKADVAGRQASPSSLPSEALGAVAREAPSSRKKTTGATRTARGSKPSPPICGFLDSNELPPF